MRLNILIPAGVSSVALLVLGLAGVAPSLRAQSTTTASTTTTARPPATPANDIPELIYLCPMAQDFDVIEGKPGKCRKCGMELQPARIKQGYGCPNHEVTVREQPGVCPLDRRELVPMAVSVFWTCPSAPNDKLMEPGKCSDGKDRTRRLAKQAHADHNPRHGGQFYMADTGLHHVEGTLPEPGLFRVYFYDEATKPMEVLGFSARAIVVDGKMNELETAPLKAGKISNTLEAALKTRTFPIQITLRIRFKPDDKERPFSFAFKEVTKEPVAATGAVFMPPSPRPVFASYRPATNGLQIRRVAFQQEPAPPVKQNEAIRPSNAPLEGSFSELMPSTVRKPLDLPKSAKELLGKLNETSETIQALINEGALPQVWKHAMDAKDYALGFEDHLNEVPAANRLKVSVAIRNAVTSSWEMEGFADLGDKQKVLEAHHVYTAAVADLKEAYAKAR